MQNLKNGRIAKFKTENFILKNSLDLFEHPLNSLSRV